MGVVPEYRDGCRHMPSFGCMTSDNHVVHIIPTFMLQSEAINRTTDDRTHLCLLMEIAIVEAPGLFVLLAVSASR